MGNAKLSVPGSSPQLKGEPRSKGDAVPSDPERDISRLSQLQDKRNAEIHDVLTKKERKGERVTFTVHSERYHF